MTIKELQMRPICGLVKRRGIGRPRKARRRYTGHGDSVEDQRLGPTERQLDSIVKR